MMIKIIDDYYMDLKQGEQLQVKSYDSETGLYNCYKEGFTNNTAVVGQSHCIKI